MNNTRNAALWERAVLEVRAALDAESAFPGRAVLRRRCQAIADASSLLLSELNDQVGLGMIVSQAARLRGEFDADDRELTAGLSHRLERLSALAASWLADNPKRSGKDKVFPNTDGLSAKQKCAGFVLMMTGTIADTIKQSPPERGLLSLPPNEFKQRLGTTTSIPQYDNAEALWVASGGKPAAKQNQTGLAGWRVHLREVKKMAGDNAGSQVRLWMVRILNGL